MSDAATGGAGSIAAKGMMAGAAATVVMSIAMFGFKRLGLMGELPPETITARMLNRLGIRRSKEAQDLLAAVNHIAFGAVGGAAFGALRHGVPGSIPTLPLGLLFATGIWAVSYAGWAPALGLMPPPQKDRPGRQPSMIAAHLVYGAALALLADQFRPGRATAARAGGARRRREPPGQQ